MSQDPLWSSTSLGVFIWSLVNYSPKADIQIPSFIGRKRHIGVIQEVPIIKYRVPNGAKLRRFSIDYQSLRPTVTMLGRISVSW